MLPTAWWHMDNPGRWGLTPGKVILSNSIVILFQEEKMSSQSHVTVLLNTYLSTKHLHLWLHEPWLSAVPLNCHRPGGNIFFTFQHLITWTWTEHLRFENNIIHHTEKNFSCHSLESVVPALVASFVDLPKRPASNRLLALNVLQVQVVLVRKVGAQVEHIYLLFCDASDPEKIF